MFCCLETLELKFIYALNPQVYILFCVNRKLPIFIILVQLRWREYKGKRWKYATEETIWTLSAVGRNFVVSCIA